MSKIQIRLSFEELAAKAGEVDHVDFVLKSKEVIRAKVKKAERDRVHIKNALGHGKWLKMAEIREIWCDQKATGP